MADARDAPPAGRIADGEHRFPLRVYYEDTDAGGIVYHANYLRWMVRARTDMLALVGIDQAAALASGTGHYVVAGAAIRFRAPARLSDAILIVSTVMQVRAASCMVHQAVMRDMQILADAEITVAFVAREGRPARQPREWIDRFERLKGSG